MNSKSTLQLAAFLFAALLAGDLAFAQMPKTNAEPPLPVDASVTSASQKALTVARPATESEPRTIRGNDAVIASASTAAVVTGPEAGLKFEDAPLAEVVHTILREIVKVSYVIHPPLTGSVTLSTQGNVSADYAMLLLENALQANGFMLAVDPRGTYHIGRPDVIRGIVPSVRQAIKNSPLPPGTGAIIVPLKYIGAAEMAAILRPVAPAEAIVRIDTVRNLLVLVGSRGQAEGWLDMVSTFDVDLLKGMSVGVFPLKFISAKEIDFALRLLGGATPASTNSGQTTAPGAAAASAGASTAGSPLSGALRIFPMENINSVLVVTPRAAYLDEAKHWIEKLDKPGFNSSEQQLFVYQVQNGSAAHLANVLGSVYGTGSAASAANNKTGVAPGLAAATAGSASVGSLSSSAGASTVQGSGLSAVTLTSGVRVIADEINNAILVYAAGAEYSKVEATLKRLDVPPTQVLIEASIIEVTLTDELKYGLQWVFSEGKGGGDIGTGVLSTVANAVVGATPAGFSYTLRNSGGDVKAVLNALAEKSLVKVISSPSLMVLNNHTASIIVGDQQPVRTGETITTGGNITNNIQYKDTGVSLTVTPSVNAGSMVTMQLNQAVSDVGAVDSATGQRSFQQRQIGSRVAVRSGEALVLGGLIRDNKSNGKAGLPWLQDLPIVGKLFGANTASTNRTELLVVITPKVVRSEQELRNVSAGLREKMQALVTEWPENAKAVDDANVSKERAAETLN